jgi:hypothetical protein
MSNRPPPVPPANRSNKGPGAPGTDQEATAEEAKVTGHDERMRNLEQQGRHGNIKQNTTNQGYQQDR